MSIIIIVKSYNYKYIYIGNVFNVKTYKLDFTKLQHIK